MFSYMASPIGTLKCPGQAVPRTRDVQVVSVIMDAACAIVSPICQSFLIFSKSSSR